MSKRIIIQSICLFFSINLATNALARGDRRDGFNFGTSVGLHSDTNRRQGISADDVSGKKTSDVRSFSPYVGYSMGGLLNLGLNFNFVTSKETAVERRTGETTETSKEINSELKSGSLFARLLFGKILYLELGGGLYHNTVKESRQEATLQNSGEFIGKRESQENKGVGPGYHVGFGVEIPVIVGFYFTSAYKNHVYQLRELKGSSSVGSKKASNQTSELSFGIAYYYQ